MAQKSKLDLLIKKHLDRLKIRKENRAEMCESQSDQENYADDQAIRLVAEFITDLKSLKRKKKP